MLSSKRLKEKKYLIVLVFFLFLFFSFGIKFVFAADGQIQDTFGRQMLEAARINAGLSTKSVYAIIGSIIKVILSLFGIFATCIVVYAGVLWMTSKGEPEKINKAKEMMKNALIGMLIVVSSYAITSFLVGKLTGIFGSPTSYEYNTGEDSGTIGGFGSGFNVVSTYPRNEMQNVKTCARVSALFNKYLYADSVNDSSVYIRDEDENKFFNPEKDEYYVSNDAFTFYHNNNDFLKDKIYRVTINSGADGVKSLAGDLLERSKSIWFRTSELEDYYPRVKATYPSQNATGACRNTFVQFQFQEGADPSNLAEMDPTTFNTNNISVEKCTGSNFSNLTCALQSGLEISSISPDSIFSGFTLNFNRMLDANSFYRIILKSSDHNPTLNPNDGIANNCGKPLDGNANGSSDGASVDKYNLYFKTGETEKCEPIITNVDPNTGYYNDRFDISGQYFGILGDVSIAGFKANDNCTENLDVDIYSVNDEKTCYVSWGDTLIQAKVPFGSVTGPLKVELTSDIYAQADNDFTVLSPYISKLDPDHGPKGEFIRISGLNFGNNEGKVYFISFTGTVTEALSPTACSSIDTWKNNEIIRETPNVPIGPYVVIVGVPKEGGGYYYSNYLIYTVTEGEPGPGLCGIEPDQAARGDPVNLVGIRFGTGGGSDKVIFSNVDIPKASTTSWADILIEVNVPQTAVDGYVSVYANSKESNKVYFNVLNISADDDTYPVIIDSPGCTIESRSPSAYKNATNACINALVEARFNIEMDTTTFANNMELYSCEGQGINCDTKVTGVVSNNGSKRIVFTPTSNLTPGIWYKAVIKTGVKALGTGKNMQSEYTWNFQTRTDNNGVCDINLLNVLPTEATLNINETTNLTANPSSSSDICAVLKPTSTPVYVWSSDDSNKVSIQTTSVNAITGVGTATILGKAQTSLTKVHATWNLLTDFSDITVIDDGHPVIVDSPGCTVESRSPSAYKNATDACINALVEARFNIEMDTTTFANNMELYSCEGQGINCNTKVIGVVSNNGSKRIVFTPTSNLTPGMWYKAVIKTGVKALGTGKNMQSEYTWNFKTRTDNNGVCDINLLNVLPTEATLNINETTNLTANPSSSSDICAVLKPTSTPVYVWSSDDSNKVSIQTTSVNAITGVGTATILGKAQTSLTKVHATWNLLTDFSDITVIDDGHPVIVDSPGCTVESRSPSAYKNATDACINALVEARFNIEMDTTTFANNMELYSCEGQGINCNTKVIGVVSNNGSKRIVFTPTSNLTPGMWYKAVIKTGVKALGTGKNMQSEYTWNFKTRTDNNGVCDINLLNVLPTEATLNINETTNLTANPSSSSDICAVLKANSPAYTWTSEDESKVEISSTSINPVTTVGIATIEGIAEVLSNKVTARYKNTSITDYADIRVNGEGGIGSSCNTSNDCADGLCCDADNLCTNNFSVCPPRIDEQASCHAENYLVTDILSNPSPYKDKTDACPNINVNVAFDLDMKTDQGHGAINNLANFIVEDCGSVYYENGCNELALEPEQIDVENNKILIWTPVNNLKQNNYYRITISSNVESLYDVKMNSNYVFVFKTRNKNCTITRVDANPGTLSLQNEYYPNGDLTPVAQSSYGLCQSIIVPPGATFAWHTNNVDKVGICSGANYTLCNNSSSNLMNISIKAKAAVVNNLVDVTITLPGDNGVFSSKDNTPQTSLVSVATCSDGIKNWNETSVDSGGVCLITTNPTNGECGIYTSTYSSSSEITHPCTAGDLDGTILYSDTLNKFTWTCRGLNGGNNVNCSANAVPNLNGVCGINQGNHITDDDIIPCAAGLLDPDHQVTFNNLTGKWEWRCLGLGTGIGTDCNALGPSSGNNPVNGVCGSNPGNYDSDSDIPHPCSAGDTSDIIFNLIWRWDCVGLHGGSTAHCNANGPIVNSCGNDICDVGLGENHTNCPSDCALSCDNDNVLDSGEICDTDQLSGKTCADFKNEDDVYYNSGSLACDTDCNYYTGFCEFLSGALNGQCKIPPHTITYIDDADFSNHSANRCSYGLASSVLGHGPWNWTCNGVDGGTNASCISYKYNSQSCNNNGVMDGDETGIDCGGTLCPSCSLTQNCGNGIKNSGEECDINDFGTSTCATFGFNSGNLRCTDTCTINTSSCYNNNQLTPTNGQCRIPPHTYSYSTFNVNDFPAICSYGLASSVSGTGPWNWTCNGINNGTNASCTANKSSGNSQSCNNNGVMDGDETGIDCGGTLCPSCSLTQNCGNGIKNSGEECDINDFGTSTCATFGFNSGNLRCTDTCTINTSSCYNNNQLTPTNGQCRIPPHTYSYSTFNVSDFPAICSYGLASSVSGTGPWNWTCNGINNGTNANCTANKANLCGNHVKNIGEECDDLDFGTSTCATFGFNSGNLICTGMCTINTVACSNTYSTTNTNGQCRVPPHTYSYQTFNLNNFPNGICSYGLASSVSGTGPWTWTCNGINNGTNASCIANKTYIAPPSCGSAVNNGPFIVLTNGSPNLCGYGSSLVGNVTISGDNNTFLWSCINSNNQSISCYVGKNNCGNGIIDTGELCDKDGPIYADDYNTAKKACDKVYGEGQYSVLQNDCSGINCLTCTNDCVLDLTNTCIPMSTFSQACTSSQSKVVVLNTTFSSQSDITSNFIKATGISNWTLANVDNTTNKAMQYSASDNSLILYKNKLDYENYIVRGYFRIDNNKEFGFMLNRDSSGSKYYKIKMNGGNVVTLYKDGSFASSGNLTNNLFVSGSLKWRYFELSFNSDKDNSNVGRVQLKISKNGLDKIGDSVSAMETVINYSDSSKNGRGFFGFYSNGTGNVLFDNINIESSDNIYEYNNPLYNFGFFFCKDNKDALIDASDTVTNSDKECSSGYKCMDRSCRSNCSGYGGYSGVYVVKGGSDNYKNSARVFIDSSNKPVMVFRVWSVPRIGDTYKDSGPFIDFETWISRLNIGGTYTPAQRVGMRDDYIIYKQGNSYYFWSSNIDTQQTKGDIYVYVLTYQEGGDEELFNEIIANTRFNTNL